MRRVSAVGDTSTATHRVYPTSSAQRVLLSLVAMPLLGGALALTWMVAWLSLLALDCAGPNARPAVVEGALYGGGLWGVCALAWMVVLLPLRLAVRGRIARPRSWLAVISVAALLGGGYHGVALALQPGPSETCQPFEMS